MRFGLARFAILLTLFSPVSAWAGELSDFNAAVEQVSAHNRVALGYLRTGNTDLAALEIDRLRDAWRAVTSRFGKPPDAFSDHAQLYTTTMVDVSTRLVTASIMMNSGHTDVARDSLNAIRTELSDLRKAAGIVVLADCVHDANAAMDALYVFNDRALDWSKPKTRFDIAGKASIYNYVLDRCDQMAPDSVKKAGEFRRLIDGAKAGLVLIPKAINTRDTDLLHRILIELRSFDNLLAFRFG
jgi:hypothetical protein